MYGNDGQAHAATIVRSRPGSRTGVGKVNPACFALTVVAVVSTSCQRSAPPVTVDEPQPGITVIAEGLSPEAKGSIAAATKQLVSDAIRKAINASLETMLQKLKINDDIERELLETAFRWCDEDRSDGDLSIFLIRRGDPAQRPETIELTLNEHAVRMTRLFTKTERPTALVTLVTISERRVTQKDVILAYADDRWQLQQPVLDRQTLR